MKEQMLSLFFLGASGLFFIIIGVCIAKFSDAKNKAHKLGLDRPLNLSFNQQMIIFLRFPEIFLPITLVFMGIIIIFIASIGFVTSIIQYFA